MATITLKQVEKTYPRAKEPSVSDFNLDIEDGEFIVFVEPSGCGKSTTLRMIAGLEDITSGELWIDDVKVNDVPPKDRDIAMVFQNYALYPHMSVFDNIAFSLKMKKTPKAEINEKVEQAASILGLEAYLKRKPKALSGGQRQRVALGRALVRNPKVFLMDEPLSNLDARLRVQMRLEITRLHKQLGATTIYVTHDQTEAMTMADRIVVMKDGVIQQIGTPKELYEQPDNVFVGSFIGSPSMSFLQARFHNAELTVAGSAIPLSEEQKDMLHRGGYDEKEILVGVRPEHVSMHDAGMLPVMVETQELLGSETLFHVKADGQPFLVREKTTDETWTGEKTMVSFETDRLLFFDKETEERIKK